MAQSQQGGHAWVVRLTLSRAFLDQRHARPALLIQSARPQVHRLKTVSVLPDLQVLSQAVRQRLGFVALALNRPSRHLCPKSRAPHVRCIVTALVRVTQRLIVYA